MIKTLFRAALAAALAFATVATVSTPASAQEKHDSNTFHKLGKAIQYPFRKNTSNLSVDVHRAEGRKSVVHRRNGDKTYRAVVTPNGNLHRKYRVGPHSNRTHYRHGRKYYTYQDHHYYMDMATGQRHMIL